MAWVGAGYSFGLNGVADVGHIMPYYGSDARPFIISLDGWAGTQRYATVWSGDQTGGDWEYIRFHIPTFIGSGLSGQPNITSDMDGIFGGNNIPVNIREFQWKTFTPMQLNMDGWGSTPKYPDILGEPAASINRWYLKLNSELMPYAYTITKEAVYGLPMIRAMFLEYPNHYTLGRATRYQFLYGPYFLVAPVYRDTQMDKEGNDIRDGKTEFEVYDDDGKTQEYLNGTAAFTMVKSAVSGESLEVTVYPTKGGYTGFEPVKSTEFRINVTERPSRISVRGGGKTVKLDEASAYEEFRGEDNVWFYNEAPEMTTGPENIGAYTVTPSWNEVPNADYYEIAFEDRLYTTIKNTYLPFEDLVPETGYSFKVRAVNKDGYSEWTEAGYSTTSDPLEFAVKGIYAQASCASQPGNAIGKLVDFDEKSLWHSKWGKGDAVPFDITLDLKSVNMLDRIEYVPREDAGNGTVLSGSISFSTDKIGWSAPAEFRWDRTGEVKTFKFGSRPDGNAESARYIKIHVSEAVGGFGSGSEMYVFRVPGTEGVLQGDINRDKRIDDNDLTSYMNYTGLRQGDADFDYVSIGDINGNGLIDSYDISVVTTMLDGGVNANDSQEVSGTVTVVPDKTVFKAGDIISIKVRGTGMQNVNALSFALPYDASVYEYMGTETEGMKEMVNLTYDRLHTDGQKALYPTFANKGNNFLIEGECDLFTIRMKARKDGTFDLKATDGMLVGRNLKVVNFTE